MRLLAALGSALIYTKGPGPEADTAWAEALAIAQSHRDSDYEIRILWGMWSSHFNSGQYLASLDIAERFRKAAKGSGDNDAALVGDRIVAVSMFYLGDHTRALQTIESMLRHYIRPRDRSHIVRFQFDQRVVARTVRSRLLWALGFPDQALREVEGLIEEATSVDHVMSLCLALAQAACPVTLKCGDLKAAEQYTELLVRHAAQNGLDIWHTWGKCFRAMLLIEGGNIDEGLAALHRALDELPQGAFYMRYTGFQGALAQALGTAGDVSNGLATIDDVLARCDRNNERWYVAECARIKGDLLRHKHTPESDEEAREQFDRAIGWARQMQTPSWELRAATSLARLLQDRGRIAEANEVLAPVYCRFNEGFATADLQMAKRLLGELSSAP
jgi:predicted ATPase